MIPEHDPKNISTYRRERIDYIKPFFPKNAVVGEIGVWQGVFTVQMVRELNPKIVHAIDPWIPYHDDTIFHADHSEMGKKIMPELNKIPNVDVIAQKSETVYHRFSDNYFDFLYLDGLHTYDQLSLELDLYWRKVKVGGILMGDDYGWQNGGGVHSLHEGDNLARAVNDFLKKLPSDSYKLDLKCHQQFIIYKIR
jgi:hypothetical protein